MATAQKYDAVKLTNSRYGDVWIVRDMDVLKEHPDISGIIFEASEILPLRGKSKSEIDAIVSVKKVFADCVVRS